MGGEDRDKRRRHSHQKDGKLKRPFATETIADLSEPYSADGTRKIPGRKNTEGIDESRERIVAWKELRADKGREVAEYGEVVPLEEVTYATRQRCSKSWRLHRYPPERCEIAIQIILGKTLQDPLFIS